MNTLEESTCLLFRIERKDANGKDKAGFSSSRSHDLVCRYPNADVKFQFIMSEDNKIALLKVYNLKA